MSNKAVLFEKFKDRPFTNKEALDLGVTRLQLSRLVEQSELFRVSRGIYQFPDSDFDQENDFRAATKIIGVKSAVCLISALAFYDLIDEIPKKIWLLVEIDKKTQIESIRLFRSREPNWDTGVLNEDGYMITDINRSIVDSIVQSSEIGDLGLKALKSALKTKKTTGDEIIAMAKKLGSLNKVLPYVHSLV